MIGIKFTRIPSMTENYTKSGTYKIPTECPVCNARLKERKTKLFCTHVTCKGVKAAHIDHYCTVMGIRKLSYYRILRMLKSPYFKKLEDLYEMKNHKVAFYNLIGKDWIDPILVDIEDSIFNCTLGQLIYALSISNKTIAQALEDYCRNDINTFMYLAEKNFSWTDAGLSEFWSDHVNTKYLRYHKTFNALSKILYIDPFIPEEEKNDKFVGMTFVISGKPEIFSSRDSLVNAVEYYGGKVCGSLHRKIDYYIDCGSLFGMSKEAKKLNIKTLTEQEFINMIEQ